MKVQAIETKFNIDTLENIIVKCRRDNGMKYAYLMMNKQTLNELSKRVDFIPSIREDTYTGIFKNFPDNKVYIDNDLPFGAVEII